MQQKLEQLEQELSDLKKQMAKIEQEKATAPPAPAQPSPPVVTQTPTVTAAEQKSEPGEEEIPTPPRTVDLYGYVMTDSGYNFGTINPNWFDIMRPTQLNHSRGNSPRTGRPSSVSDRHASELNQTRRQNWEISRPSSSSNCSAPASMLARRRSGCGMLRGIGTDRRGSNVESVHGHRRVPEPHRVLGPERNGVLPQRASALDTLSKRR